MGGGTPQILVVDGNPRLFCGLSDTLRNSGLSVLAVRESAEALDALDEGFTPLAIVAHFATGDCKAAELLRDSQSKRGIRIVSISAPLAPGLLRIGAEADLELGETFSVAELLTALGSLPRFPDDAADRRS